MGLFGLKPMTYDQWAEQTMAPITAEQIQANLDALKERMWGK